MSADSRVIDVEAALALCDRATQGLRHVDQAGDCEGVVIAHVGDYLDVCVDALLDLEETDARADAEYLATFDPGTLRALLIELRTRRAATDELVAAVDYLAHVAARTVGVEGMPTEVKDEALEVGDSRSAPLVRVAEYSYLRPS